MYLKNTLPAPFWACLLTLCTSFGVIAGCKRAEDLSKTTINPAFEQNPPIAEEVSIQMLKDNQEGNLKMVANLGEQVKTPFHAIMIGDEKVVFRDDGKGGDSLAGDGRFTLIIKEDLDGLENQIREAQKRLGNQREIISFNGRLMLRDRFEPKEIFDLERFRRGEPFLFDRRFTLCVPSGTVDKSKSLMIAEPSVVNDTNHLFNPCTQRGDPDGAWSFGHLMSQMANTTTTGISATDFLMKWLQTWAADVTVNGDLVTRRMEVNQIINTWQSLSGGTFDIKFAPFRLLAIVNRLDLRGNSGYGFNNAGEGRFVFCAITCSRTSMNVFTSPSRPFVVILEYGIPKNTCAATRAYATEWANLSGMTPGTPAYNNALAAITRQFTDANTSPGKPNGSSLNQIRTNDFALGSPWEMREFNIDSSSHLLATVTVKQEAQVRFNKNHPAQVPADVATMAKFVNDNEALVLANRYAVPESFDGKQFLAGKSHILNAFNYHWNGTAAAGPEFINHDNARFGFSLNTCSGCHGGDAFTGNFMHVGPGLVPGSGGVPARLSQFLTGNPPFSRSAFGVPDRANRPPAFIREFNDLERRKIDLENFASCGCNIRIRLPLILEHLRFRPLNMTH